MKGHEQRGISRGRDAWMRVAVAAIGFVVAGVQLPTFGQAVSEKASALSLWHDAFQLTATTRSISRPFVIDATDAVSVRVLAASQTLTVTLVSPAGAAYTVGQATTPVFQSSVSLINSQTTKSGASYFGTVIKPVSGKWTLAVSDSVAPAAPLNVMATVFINNSTRLALVGGGASYPLGANVRLALVAFDGSKRVSGLTIKAWLFRSFDPTFTPVAVTFRDDGTGADETAGDRIYEAFVNPGQSSNYQVQADVSGTASTGSFQRSAAVTLRVVDSLVQVTGFSDQGVDDNADGLVDRVVVTPTATVSFAGTYSVQVRLRASNGRELTQNVETAVAAGIASVDVAFNADAINAALGVDGPYTVAEVRWYQIVNGDPILAGVRGGLGLTHAYSLVQMQHQRLRLSGAGDAAGVDVFRTGIFEFLDIHLGINADFAGTYSYSASLIDRNGHELGFVNGSAQLASGANTLSFRFEGSPISRNNVDGPYLLSDLIVVGGGQSLLQTTAFTTPAFKAASFVPPRRRPSGH